MRTLLKIELERAFRGIGIKIALLIGLLISIANLVLEVYPKTENPLRVFVADAQMLPYNVFNSWIGGRINFEYSLFIFIIPILVVIPYGATYFSDMKSGVIKNYYTRIEKKKYLIAKSIAVFLSAGVVTVVPLIVNLAITSAMLPSIIPQPTGEFSIRANAIWSSIFYTYPYIYIMLYMLVIFLLSGCIACVTLSLSLFANNKFVAMLFPFLLCNVIRILSSYSYYYVINGLGWTRIFDMTQMGVNFFPSILIDIILFASIGIFLFWWKGGRDDAL